MASIAAKRTAEEVLVTIGKGKKPNVTKIAHKNGYAMTTAGSGLVQKTQTYQDTINPFVAQLEKERQRVIKAMMSKDLTEVQYDKLSNVMDTLTKNMQLLSGKETERVGLIPIQISEEIANKNKLNGTDTITERNS